MGTQVSILTMMEGEHCSRFFTASAHRFRFTDKVLKEEERRPHLVNMVQAYLDTMADLGAETWLMHGTLMGWWWNGKVCHYTLCSQSCLRL